MIPIRALFASPPDLPRLGARMPGFVIRIWLAVLGIGLCFICYQQPFWILVGILLTGVAVAIPGRLAAWALVLFLGASQLPQDSSPLDWQFLVLLAGLHLIHVLAAYTFVIPPLRWVQLLALRPALLRFVAIQVPVQAVAVVALLLLAPEPDGSRNVALPALGIVGAVALVVLAGLLAVPLLRERGK
jgi:hypothetical protein